VVGTCGSPHSGGHKIAFARIRIPTEREAFLVEPTALHQTAPSASMQIPSPVTSAQTRRFERLPSAAMSKAARCSFEGPKVATIGSETKLDRIQIDRLQSAA
jgi:hypothetical protein